MVKFSNPFEAMMNTSAEDAKVMHLQSSLMILIVNKVRKEKLTQSEVAEMLNVTQPRVSNLMNGYISKFSVDELIKYMIRMELWEGFDMSSVLGTDGKTTVTLSMEIKS